MTTENIKNRVWENEGKSYPFIDKETNYGCYIYRHPRRGHLCGYVDIPRSHPLYGIDHANEIFDMITGDIKVHGGISFTGRLNNPYNNKELPDYFDDLHDWLIGFDCNHAEDYAPFRPCDESELIELKQEYRTAEYVADECKKLAKQLKALENKELSVVKLNSDWDSDDVELSCNECGKSYFMDEMIELGDDKLIYTCDCGYENLII